MSLIPNWKFFIFLVLDILGLVIMSDDHLLKNKPSKTIKKNQFKIVAILKFFQRGKPKILVKNWKFPFCFWTKWT